MFTQTRKSILATAIALTLIGATGAVAGETASQEITDARQEAQIWTTYALSPYLRANDIQVSVHNGKATLTGQVEEDVNKDLAKQIALGVNGVREVDNRIVVKADYVPPARSAARGYAQSVDDATITAAVKSKLLWSKHASGMSANVETRAGKVTLRGTADSPAARELAGKLAMNTRGVESVDNQLKIAASKPAMADAKASGQSAGKDIADAWITAKVKSTYGYSSNVNGSDIDVSTRAGVVTLSGKVDSGAERALAIELAQNIRGVKSVDSTALEM